MAPLVREFFSGRLTLQQLSRIEIRRAIGMPHFERRVNALPLPPLILGYVSKAMEMLTDFNCKFPLSHNMDINSNISTDNNDFTLFAAIAIAAAADDSDAADADEQLWRLMDDSQ